MTLLTVCHSLHRYLNFYYKETKLVLSCIMQRVPLGLALQYRYYSLTLDNNFELRFTVVLIVFIFAFLLYL